MLLTVTSFQLNLVNLLEKHVRLALSGVLWLKGTEGHHMTGLLCGYWIPNMDTTSDQLKKSKPKLPMLRRIRSLAEQVHTGPSLPLLPPNNR